ncbi:MAG: hypothetical protein IJI03_20890 [Rudaea sp.]|uniref:hypothetical protein n=1 Tax=Rudaea sp. 3F27F6 TaxID=2502208 RepID=UPI001484EAEE|nr:hypothetical protein [Rudaea sp. 3F27F6]MBR0347715.1 hypothetical protein [Rudaea sp.]
MCSLISFTASVRKMASSGWISSVLLPWDRLCKVFKGIKTMPATMKKQGKPLQITHLSRVCDGFDAGSAKLDLSKVAR